MALSEGRNTKRRDAVHVSHPIATATTIFAGGMVTLLASGGWAVPAGTASAGACVGVAEETVVNAGSNGDESVTTRKGCFQFLNSASTDLITRAEIGATCYIVDDQTVAKTDNSGAREAAGVIVAVDANGVWVDFR
jgi:predicted RecA/RadA family phage recombinase